jgi:hypothetical protein
MFRACEIRMHPCGSFNVDPVIQYLHLDAFLGNLYHLTCVGMIRDCGQIEAALLVTNAAATIFVPEVPVRTRHPAE